MDKIGEAIRLSRKAQGLSQEQLGKPLGMSRATISGIETGKINEIGVRKLMAICAALGLALSVGSRSAYPTLQQLRQEHHDQKRR